MAVLKVHASTCDIEPMVQSDDLRRAFVARLRAAMTHSGYQEWGMGARLAKIAGATPKAASKWLNAEAMPSRAKMLAIADALSVRAEWLEYGEGEMLSTPYGLTDSSRGAMVTEAQRSYGAQAAAGSSNVEGNPARVKDGLVPVVGMAQLGTNGYFEALDFPVGHGDGYVRIYSDDPNAYALKVVGDSMEPRIRSGEYVLIEPNRGYLSGDEVLVRTVDGQSMIKVFMFCRDGQVRLLSVNDAHSPLTMPEAAIEKIHPVGAILKASRFVDMA